MWKKILFFPLLFGLLFLGDFYYHKSNQTLSKRTDINIVKPSISAIEKDIAKKGPQEGSMAQDFELENVDGKKVKLSDYKGEKVILNFWATWCPPCKSEMQDIENFYKKNKGNKVVVLAVNLTNLEKNKNNIQQFIKAYHLTFPVLLDSKGSVANLYQSITIPTTFIINTTGRIDQKIVGPMKKDQLETLISKTK
ncbi:peroxiredoxin [Bacillus sp. EB600]|uniref:peroxiredoxin family protein n=1 Tax=Bacillus sp. EB600 TaxID=2806345 RepID=UPI00210ABC4F|nr:TlpA disulfide reductase family protein [Bacillus sp. EB600]MCQ6281228.1 TlpA family protein disulfide reductase [Bacillus sp. EB600]